MEATFLNPNPKARLHIRTNTHTPQVCLFFVPNQVKVTQTKSRQGVRLTHVSTPGYPLLSNLRFLVYPAAFECHKCASACTVFFFKICILRFFFLFVRGPGLGWADGFFAHRVPEGLIGLVLGLGKPFVALIDSPSERLVLVVWLKAIRSSFMGVVIDSSMAIRSLNDLFLLSTHPLLYSIAHQSSRRTLISIFRIPVPPLP